MALSNVGNQHDYLLKAVLVGNMAVGKTSILLRYTDDTFTDGHIATIGVDFKIKSMSLPDCLVKMQLWDTAGQERFRSIASSFYRGADGVIVVYDVTDMSSFEKVSVWFKEIEHYGSANCVRLLLGNKTDLATKRVVPTEQGKALADKLRIPFLETSAKDTVNVHQAFDTMIKAMVEQRRSNPLLPQGKTSDTVDFSSKEADSGWCFGSSGSCSLL